MITQKENNLNKRDMANIAKYYAQPFSKRDESLMTDVRAKQNKPSNNFENTSDGK